MLEAVPCIHVTFIPYLFSKHLKNYFMCVVALIGIRQKPPRTGVTDGVGHHVDVGNRT